jgi:hypothetical protein
MYIFALAKFIHYTYHNEIWGFQGGKDSSPGLLSCDVV